MIVLTHVWPDESNHEKNRDDSRYAFQKYVFLQLLHNVVLAFSGAKINKIDELCTFFSFSLQLCH